MLQRDRNKLERLLRYGLRPPFAQRRLSLLPDGRVRLKLRKPYYTGQRDVLFEPVDFLKRLAAAIPAAKAAHDPLPRHLCPQRKTPPRPQEPAGAFPFCHRHPSLPR